MIDEDVSIGLACETKFCHIYGSAILVTSQKKTRGDSGDFSLLFSMYGSIKTRFNIKPYNMRMYEHVEVEVPSNIKLIPVIFLSKHYATKQSYIKDNLCVEK